MMETVGHYVYFVQMCVAGSDGELEKEEIDNVCQRAAAVNLIGIITGMPGGGDEVRKISEAEDYYNSHNSNTIGMAFAEAIGGIAASVNPPYDREVLKEFYDAMVGVAAADGEIESGERRLLDFAREQWGL